MKLLTVPLNKFDVVNLKAGDEVLLTGTVYTARDQAHKRLTDLVKEGKKLPLELSRQVVYYCGPTATPKGKVIGACGPTTSGRMDEFTPQLLNLGVAALIGKGRRSKNVREAIKNNGAVYFVAPAGCGALLAKKVIKNSLVAFKDLGPEAIYKLEVKDFPLIVAIDAQGNSIYADL